MALLPFPSFSFLFFLFFSSLPYFVPSRFSSVERSPRLLDSFFSALSKRNFATKIRDESRISFLVFNGPMENRFGSDAIAANLFRAAFTIARVSHSWQNGEGKRYLCTWIGRAFCHGFVAIRLYSCHICARKKPRTGLTVYIVLSEIERNSREWWCTRGISTEIQK